MNRRLSSFEATKREYAGGDRNSGRRVPVMIKYDKKKSTSYLVKKYTIGKTKKFVFGNLTETISEGLC